MFGLSYRVFYFLFFLLTVENLGSGGTWRDRLTVWKEILRKEELAEQLGSLNSKYVVEFDMKEVENSLRKDVVEKAKSAQGTRALWISKRWWRYRPKLPYTYFLQKLDSSEVKILSLFIRLPPYLAPFDFFPFKSSFLYDRLIVFLSLQVEAVVFTEDLKRLYVTMKEGFPLEYIVSPRLWLYSRSIACLGLPLAYLGFCLSRLISRLILSYLRQYQVLELK